MYNALSFFGSKVGGAGCLTYFKQIGRSSRLYQFYLYSAKRTMHRGFLESAGPQNSCDHLNALGDNQLPADSHSAWKLHACMHTSIPVRQLIVTQCIQVVTKNTVHHKACVLSRKPLWDYGTCFQQLVFTHTLQEMLKQGVDKRAYLRAT